MKPFNGLTIPQFESQQLLTHPCHYVFFRSKVLGQVRNAVREANLGSHQKPNEAKLCYQKMIKHFNGLKIPQFESQQLLTHPGLQILSDQ